MLVDFRVVLPLPLPLPLFWSPSWIKLDRAHLRELNRENRVHPAENARGPCGAGYFTGVVE